MKTQWHSIYRSFVTNFIKISGKFLIKIKTKIRIKIEAKKTATTIKFSRIFFIKLKIEITLVYSTFAQFFFVCK